MDRILNGQDHQDMGTGGKLLVDLASMKNGFLKVKRYRQEIWEYIEYRESLIKWPPMNEQIRGGML